MWKINIKFNFPREKHFACRGECFNFVWDFLYLLCTISLSAINEHPLVGPWPCRTSVVNQRELTKKKRLNKVRMTYSCKRLVFEVLMLIHEEHLDLILADFMSYGCNLTLWYDVIMRMLKSVTFNDLFLTVLELMSQLKGLQFPKEQTKEECLLT